MSDRTYRVFDDVLARAEGLVALLARARPREGALARRLVQDALVHRSPLSLRLTFDPAPNLDACRRALDAVVTHAPERGPLGALYGERAVELALEAQMVACLGGPTFRGLARRRFARADAVDGSWAAARAEAWARLPVEDLPTIPSDDTRHPHSLISSIRAEVGRARLPVRVVVEDLDVHAAVGDRVIYVGRGKRHSVPAARRIAVHEVEAHAAPRVRAEGEALGLFRVGTAGASEDEEGRALAIEERAGLLDAARRRELAWRHVAARSVLDGAEILETARMLSDLGAAADAAADITCRVHRGGGLAREIAYLPAFHRAKRELSRHAALESWLSRGRLSFRAARRLGGFPAEGSSGASQFTALAPEVLPFA